MSLQKETLSYECTGPFPEPGEGFVKLGQFHSGVRHNCQISIWIETDELTPDPTEWEFVARNINILVKKSNETPARVDIRLLLAEHRDRTKVVSISVDDWGSSCYIRDCQVESSPGDSLSVVLQITWSLPKSPMLPLNASHFLMNETFSDVSIVIGGEKLSAHKVILGAASPVFLAMLTCPMKEAAENCIDIQDVEVDVMKAILSFLYTGEDGNFGNADMALKVLVAAEKYDMQELKGLCEQKLFSTLNTANVLQILDAADTYQAHTIANECMAFIVNHKKEMADVPYFEEICTKKPRLVMDFLKAIA